MASALTVVLVEIRPKDTTALLVFDTLEQIGRVGQGDIVLTTVSDCVVMRTSITHTIHVDELGKVGRQKRSILDIWSFSSARAR